MLLEHDPVHAFMPYPPVAVASSPEGPLAGLTLAVKDLFDVAGYRTGCGCPTKLAESDIKTKTAPVVQKLRDAGARFVGKTHTDELAWSLYGMNVHFGTPINAAAPDRIPGGSSSGSAAAVAAGLADIGLGTDTGGSVRAPSSFCGLWGIRPTHARISLEGCMELAASFDTCGFFARDAKTLAETGAVVLGNDRIELPDTPRLIRPVDMVARLGEEQKAVYDSFLVIFLLRKQGFTPQAALMRFMTPIVSSRHMRPSNPSFPGSRRAACRLPAVSTSASPRPDPSAPPKLKDQMPCALPSVTKWMTCSARTASCWRR